MDVDIASAMASKEADKKKILNSIALPRARTKNLEQEARATHESSLVETLLLNPVRYWKDGQNFQRGSEIYS